MKRNDVLRFLLFLALAGGLITACDDAGSPDEEERTTATVSDAPTAAPTATAPRASRSAAGDKWSLWVDGPHLRGANIWQAVVIPELDGPEFKGPGPVGPPYTQQDFDRLAALGANYVSISGPGLFTETPPFAVDPGIQAHLDQLLTMIANADMFATIGFRTGPGRSEFTLCCEGDSYFEGYFNDSMWEDRAAQDAWVEMWRYTAQRYKDNPIVVGYKLMVEPNAAGVFLDIYDPTEFYPAHAGTLYDWNQLYPRIVAAIREVDPSTPLLVGGMGWSGVAWLPFLQHIDDPKTVYVVHQYAPQEEYTHQEPGAGHTYPGMLDLDWDGQADRFDRAWLDNLLSPVGTFMARYGAPVAVDEYGVNRWAPGGAEFMNDEMALFEQQGVNYALWEWQTSWAPFAGEVHDMNYLLGPDPDNHTARAPNALLEVIKKYWALNTARPSTMRPASTPPASGGSGSEWWKPQVGATWQWQLGDPPVDSSFDVVMYDIDMFEHDAATVAALHAQGHRVICYISVGSWEDWRPDRDRFPASLIGKDYDGWPGENWLDIRQIDLLAPIMRARLDECQAKGFDGVEPDNIDGYANDTGFPLTAQDQLAYNIWLANEAHARGLSIGLKNDSDQVLDLLPYFDWAMTEDCFAEGWCEQMTPFIAAGKPVFAAEYTDMDATLDQFCPQAKALRFSAILKNRDLDAWRQGCPQD